MTKFFTMLMIAIVTAVSAQGKFEAGMQKAMGLWGEGKTTEASAMFERIAAAEPTQWLPNYYVSLVNVTTAFQTKDKATQTALLEKAQQTLDIELGKNANNAELYVIQALIYTGYIIQDPMTNGMVYSPKAMGAYAKAEVIDPKNPRVIFGKAEFEIGGARYFGKDTKPMCAEIDRAIGLFQAEKPETPLHPNWGLDRALEAQKECSKK